MTVTKLGRKLGENPPAKKSPRFWSNIKVFVLTSVYTPVMVYNYQNFFRSAFPFSLWPSVAPFLSAIRTSSSHKVKTTDSVWHRHIVWERRFCVMYPFQEAFCSTSVWNQNKTVWWLSLKDWTLKSRHCFEWSVTSRVLYLLLRSTGTAHIPVTVMWQQLAQPQTFAFLF